MVVSFVKMTTFTVKIVRIPLLLINYNIEHLKGSSTEDMSEVVLYANRNCPFCHRYALTITKSARGFDLDPD
jgi:hypothetical protein